MPRFLLLLISLLLLSRGALAQRDTVGTAPAATCASCAEWNAPQKPFAIFGNAYYVGTHGLGAVLVTSPQGHILIDGALPESAPSIMAHIRALGFKVEDVKLILNSHAHFDHSGGIAALQRASGAQVAASPASAATLERGGSTPSDPQYGIALDFPPIRNVRVIADGDTMRVGPLALVAHFTPGHTPGGTTWTWRSCERDKCLDLVYADSQSPVSADDFFFTHNKTYPAALTDFAHSFAVLDGLACDILVTPHPGASSLWDRLAGRDRGDSSSLIDPTACRRYAAMGRDALAKRVAAESSKRPKP